MPHNDDLPFPVGTTFLDGATPDANNLGAGSFLGREYIVNDQNPLNNTIRSPRQRKLRVVRNTAGANLLPKFAVTFESVAGKTGQTTDGRCDVEAERVAGLVDEYLPAAGVADDDVFYIVLEGPAMGKVSRVAAESPIALDDLLVAATAATSGATTAGRLKTVDLTGATAVLAGQLRNVVGRALSARTTADTGADILVDLNIQWA